VGRKFVLWISSYASTTHFFELDLKPDAGGELVKLRVDYAIPRAKLEAAVAQEAAGAAGRLNLHRHFSARRWPLSKSSGRGCLGHSSLPQNRPNRNEGVIS